jgi:hypothetical protein
MSNAIPKGWRRLRYKEVIRSGDYYHHPSEGNDWHPYVYSVGSRFNFISNETGIRRVNKHCRKNPNKEQQ